MIDTHCHLGLLDREGELEQAVEAALAAGLTHVVDVGLDLRTSAEALERAEALASTGLVVGVAVGWHPHQGRPPTGPELQSLEDLCAHPRVVAVGEIGIDYHWTEWHSAPADVQAEAFRAMLDLAGRCRLPVVIHDRDASADLYRVVRESGLRDGVMHCFLGDSDLAREALALGFDLSLAGPLTYPRSEALRQVAASVPLDRLLVETDSPFLPPQPHRGKRNQPAWVTITAARLLEVRREPAGTVAGALAANALRRFSRLSML
ncbi:MAG: TatD family hydrolase [Candidatus Dormibacteria bacterium]